MQQQDCEKIGLIIPNVWPYFRVPVVGRMKRLPPTSAFYLGVPITGENVPLGT